MVDSASTAAYHMHDEPCHCLYCRNYQSAFSDTYPKLAEVLQKFGICVNRPLEVMNLFWNETKDKRLYISYYSVKGELYKDKLEIYSNDDALITLYHPDSDALVYGNTRMERPYFIAEVSNIQLPWVLTEPPED
jgi:hypothetical protein